MVLLVCTKKVDVIYTPAYSFENPDNLEYVIGSVQDVKGKFHFNFDVYSNKSVDYFENLPLNPWSPVYAQIPSSFIFWCKAELKYIPSITVIERANATGAPLEEVKLVIEFQNKSQATMFRLSWEIDESINVLLLSSNKIASDMLISNE